MYRFLIYLSNFDNHCKIDFKCFHIFWYLPNSDPKPVPLFAECAFPFSLAVSPTIMAEGVIDCWCWFSAPIPCTSLNAIFASLVMASFCCLIFHTANVPPITASKRPIPPMVHKVVFQNGSPSESKIKPIKFRQYPEHLKIILCHNQNNYLPETYIWNVFTTYPPTFETLQVNVAWSKSNLVTFMYELVEFVRVPNLVACEYIKKVTSWV